MRMYLFWYNFPKWRALVFNSPSAGTQKLLHFHRGEISYFTFAENHWKIGNQIDFISSERERRVIGFVHASTANLKRWYRRFRLKLSSNRLMYYSLLVWSNHISWIEWWPHNKLHLKNFFAIFFCCWKVFRLLALLDCKS